MSVRQTSKNSSATVIAAVLLLVLVTAIAVLTILPAARVGGQLAEQGSSLIERARPRAPLPPTPRHVQTPAAAPEQAATGPSRGANGRP